ncbi:MAG: transcriptional regulator [Verrucomicrobia bacterium]|nr:transcriptional regulator [Verrucomicrobiota bacterium]
MPSEHSLAGQVQVSRVTLRAAIKILVREKRLLVANGQRARILAAPRTRRVVGSRIVGVVSPALIGASSRHASYYETYRHAMQEGGAHVNFYHGARFYGPNPDKALERLMRESKADAWVVTGSTARMQGWFSDRQIPVIVDGSCQPGVRLAALDLDYRAVCRHAVGNLLGLGHRRVVFLGLNSGAGGDLASELGFREGFQKSALPGLEPRIVHCEENVRNVTATLARLFRGAGQPTAIMAQRWLPFTALTFLQQSGRRVPGDVSLLARDDLPNLDLLVPSIARYGFPATLYTQRMVRLTWKLFLGTLAPKQEFILPDFIPGTSLGHARKA